MDSIFVAASLHKSNDELRGFRWNKEDK